jgi:predicted metal-binding membrane protein
MNGPARESLVKRDRAVVAVGLIGMAALAWAYLVRVSGSTAEMAMHMAMPDMESWGAGVAGALFVMGAVMMVAMMTPAAAPMVLMFAAVNRRQHRQDGPVVRTAAFVLGYVVVWSVYAAVATLGQWALHNAALLSEEMASTSPRLAGALLITAGAFQWTPVKHACLAACRSPLSFLMAHWRAGVLGAWLMGVRHGAYCVGCCWVLMALLFVAGVMNLTWIAAIAAFVLVEKVVPWGETVGRVAGVLLVAAGLRLIAGPWLWSSAP